MYRRFLALAVLGVSLTLSFTAAPVGAQEPKFKIPDLTFKIVNFSSVGSPGTCPETQGHAAAQCISIPWIGEYIASLYVIAVSAATLLAAIVLLISGFIWLTAAGNTNRISLAQNYAGGAILGLVVMLGSYVILYAINPQLTQFKALTLTYLERKDLESAKKIAEAGYCKWSSSQLTCPTGTKPASDPAKSCGTTSDTSMTLCCCKEIAYAPGDIKYQANIQAQQADASAGLASFIACFAQKFPQGITINSISDSAIETGNCKPWLCSKAAQSGCAHKCEPGKISAHYGGINNTTQSKNDTQFSYAVDIDNTIPYSDAITAAVACGATELSNGQNNEGDHYHFPIPGSGSS